MEYPFKLSEIIAGCENGAWLKDAIFVNEQGYRIMFDGEYFEGVRFSHINDKWTFKMYCEE